MIPCSWLAAPFGRYVTLHKSKHRKRHSRLRIFFHVCIFYVVFMFQAITSYRKTWKNVDAWLHENGRNVVFHCITTSKHCSPIFVIQWYVAPSSVHDNITAVRKYIAGSNKKCQFVLFGWNILFTSIIKVISINIRMIYLLTVNIKPVQISAFCVFKVLPLQHLTAQSEPLFFSHLQNILSLMISIFPIHKVI